MTIAQMIGRLGRVGIETVTLSRAAGRVLAEPVAADRDSPPCDVSAMDGYALRLDDASLDPLPVSGEVAMGRAPEPMRPGHAMRIFTGGPVPAGAETVVRREDTHESPEAVRVRPDAADLKPGANIRRRGENIRAGDTVVEPGCVIDAADVTAMATFGAASVRVYRPVRVGIIVTGNELRRVDETPGDCEIRDSNGPALEALLAGLPWVDCVGATRARDDFDALRDTLEGLLARCDTIFLTGGVSMGDHDHVPAVVASLGAETVFHKLPIRPGKPLLGAIGPVGGGDQAIFGLPGNPVSVITTARRFVLPALARQAGLVMDPAPPIRMTLRDPDDKTIPLWWYRPVRRIEPGVVELVRSRGSGDVVAAARSGGFIEQPPGTSAPSEAWFWDWRP